MIPGAEFAWAEEGPDRNVIRMNDACTVASTNDPQLPAPFENIPEQLPFNGYQMSPERREGDL